MKTSIDILKTWFQTGDKPTEQQFANLIDSFHHKDDGDLITSYTLATNGDLTLTFSDEQTVTAEKFVLPNTMPQTFIDGLVAALNGKVDKVTGKQLTTNDFTTALKNKLDALTQYVHPDAHAISFITGLQDALDDKVDKVDGKDLSDENYTAAEKQKLAGLQNYTHPATHTIAEVSGLQADLDQIEQDLDDKVDAVDGKALSDENYTAAEKQKLADLYQTDPDGKSYHIVRTDAVADVAPTATEVAEPKAGDTAIVTLSNGVVELYSYTTTWAKDSTMSASISFKNYLNSEQWNGNEISFGQYFDLDVINKRISLPVRLGGTATTAFFGTNALLNAAGNYLNAFGAEAMKNNTGSHSSGFGHGALIGNTGSQACGFGVLAMGSNSGANASGFGAYALHNNSGQYSSGFGANALYHNSGNRACGVGAAALFNNTGDFCNGVGANALLNNTGNNVVAIGFEAGRDNTFSNVAIIGHDLEATKSNQVALGNTSVTEVLFAEKLAVDVTAIHGAADNTPLKVTTVNGVKTITV